MACLNVAEWTPEQVADWLSGVGPSVAQYIPALQARGLDGQRLLMLRCDDLDYLGMHVIGHQELLLEAVEYLRNFHYELNRECIQQLAMRVYVNAECVCRALNEAGDGRLETQALADVARAVAAVKPLAGWLDRWAGGAGAREELLRAALEAAASAQRERFAERPARAVAAAAARAAAAAALLATAALDPVVLRCATLPSVSLRQGDRPLGFRAATSPCARHQVCDVRFGSPAHASGAVHDGDEIVQVGGRCVVGWGAGAVLAACEGAARAARATGGELALRLRRRAARPPRLRLRPQPPAPPLPPPPDPLDSDDSGPLSPPASPAPHPLDSTRIFLPKPQTLVRRRHSVSGGSPTRKPDHTIDHFWQHLKEQRGASAAGLSPEPDEETRVGAGGGGGGGGTLETRGSDEERRARLDKAHSTPAYELEAPPAPPPPAPPDTPVLTYAVLPPTVVGPGAVKADQILDFKKSSTQIGEAMQHRRTDNDELSAEESGRVGSERVLETINIAMMEHAARARRRSLLAPSLPSPPSPPSLPSPPSPPLPSAGRRRHDRGNTPEHLASTGGGCARASPPSAPPSGPPLAPPLRPTLETLPVLRAVRGDPAPLTSPLKPTRTIDAAQISIPLRHVSGLEARAPRPRPSARPPSPPPSPPCPPVPLALSPTAPRTIFPTSKSRSLKKKNSLLARRRGVSSETAAAAGGVGGGVWQRVRGAGAGRARWARRWLVVAEGALLAYRGQRGPRGARAAVWLPLGGCTAQAAPEVRSRPHAFKVYRPGAALYFAAPGAPHAAAWLRLLHHHTLQERDAAAHIPDPFSETDYSDATSEDEDDDPPLPAPPLTHDPKDKSKFGSLRKLTGRMQRSESQEQVAVAVQGDPRPPSASASSTSTSTSLDRKYLRFFSRHKTKDDHKTKGHTSPPVLCRTPAGTARAASPPPPPTPPPPAPGASAGAGAGLVTLEQFMLQAQAEERATNTARLLHAHTHTHPHTVSDVVYGDVSSSSTSSGGGGGGGAAVSVKGRDGYEKIVYADEKSSRSPPSPPGTGAGAGGVPHLGQALRRNDRVHSRTRDQHNDSWSSSSGGTSPAGASAGAGAGAVVTSHSVSKLRLMFGGRQTHVQQSPTASGSRGGHYPHLVCPPTFQPESYSLATRAPPSPPPPPLPPPPPPRAPTS